MMRSVPRVRVSRSVPAGLLVFLVAACGGTAPAAPVDTPSPTHLTAGKVMSEPIRESKPALDEQFLEPTPDDWKEYVRSEHGFSLSLPESWVVLDPSTQDLDAMLSLAGEALGEQFNTELVRSVVGSGVPMLAINSDFAAMGDAGTPPSVNVIVQPASGVSLDLMLPIIKGQIETNLRPAGGVETASFRTFAGKGSHLTYALGSVALSGQIDQFLVVDQKTLVILTFTGEASVADTAWYQRDVAQILSTLRLL